MPAPYSNDLRVRVLDALLVRKEKLKEVSFIFKVSIRTIKRWSKLKIETGNCEAKKDYQKGHSHVIKDLEKFKNLVENTEFSTIQDIVNILKVGSTDSIGRALKKIKYVKKKV